MRSEALSPGTTFSAYQRSMPGYMSSFSRSRFLSVNRSSLVFCASRLPSSAIRNAGDFGNSSPISCVLIRFDCAIVCSFFVFQLLWPILEKLGQIEILVLVRRRLGGWSVFRHAIKSEVRHTLTIRKADVHLMPAHLENKGCSSFVVASISSKVRVHETRIVDPHLSYCLITCSAIDCNARGNANHFLRAQNVEFFGLDLEPCILIGGFQLPIRERNSGPTFR